MPRIHIPASLRAHAHQLPELEIEGSTVGEILMQLASRYPDLGSHLMRDSKQLHPFISLYIDGKNIRDLQQWETPITDNQELLIVPALAGG